MTNLLNTKECGPTLWIIIEQTFNCYMIIRVPGESTLKFGVNERTDKWYQCVWITIHIFDVHEIIGEKQVNSEVFKGYSQGQL